MQRGHHPKMYENIKGLTAPPGIGRMRRGALYQKGWEDTGRCHLIAVPRFERAPAKRGYDPI